MWGSHFDRNGIKLFINSWFIEVSLQECVPTESPALETCNITNLTSFPTYNLIIGVIFWNSSEFLRCFVWLLILTLLQARLEVGDLFLDLADGRMLLRLLEIISGEKLGKPNNGRMRVHWVENVNKSLAFLHTKVGNFFLFFFPTNFYFFNISQGGKFCLWKMFTGLRILTRVGRFFILK